MYSSSPLSSNQEFERLLAEGISAAKNDQHRLAQSLLRQAIILNGTDSRPYVWLSATTNDPQERREYLEQAIAIDPGNSAARRGLALILGKINPEQILPEGSQVQSSKEPEEAGPVKTFRCPQCGGQMSFSADSGGLVCSYCGFSKPAETGVVGEKAEQVLDFVMPTLKGHYWAAAQVHLSCNSCGAVNILPPGEKTARCPYCGSNQWFETSIPDDFIEPQTIGPIKVDADEAKEAVRKWFGQGIFTPDDLVTAFNRMRLRPAYYSCWTFDGTLEVPWTCEVREGSGDNARWVSRNGVEGRFFDDILVPGVKVLQLNELKSIEPFPIKELVAFNPEFLAGWHTLIYDRSLADASLLARERVIKQIRSQLTDSIEPGREKRNLNTGVGNWSGMTFKHVLLPIWVGAYRYKDKEYRVLVNGQTGKTGGTKPRDTIKIVIAVIILGLLVLLAVLLYFIFASLNQTA